MTTSRRQADMGARSPGATLFFQGLITSLVVASSALVGGCRARPDATPQASLGLTVATYNIRHGRGIDDLVDLARTETVIRAFDADLVALQEVDQGVERSRGVAEADRLGDGLGMEAVFAPFFPYQGGEYGLALLSRWPVVDADTVRLPEGNEPRVALAVRVLPPGGDTLTVVVVHFDWVADDAFRYAQAQVTARYLDSLTGPWIILGDFNDQPGSRTLDLFHARARPAEKPASDRFTFSSTAPVKEIDFIFAAPPAAWDMGLVTVIDEPMASDHRPVVARLLYRH